ncbi:NERD domain-containing protein [Plasmodiophora brassicae]
MVSIGRYSAKDLFGTFVEMFQRPSTSSTPEPPKDAPPNKSLQMALSQIAQRLDALLDDDKVQASGRDACLLLKDTLGAFLHSETRKSLSPSPSAAGPQPIRKLALPADEPSSTMPRKSPSHEAVPETPRRSPAHVEYNNDGALENAPKVDVERADNKREGGVRRTVMDSLATTTDAVDRTLSLLKDDDLAEWSSQGPVGRGMTRAGFKMLLVNEALHDGFEVSNDFHLKGQHIDLVLRKTINGTRVHVIVMVKYIRAAFIKSVDGHSLEMDPNKPVAFANRYDALNDVVGRLNKLDAANLPAVTYVASGAKPFETVEWLIQDTAEHELIPYMEEMIDDLDGHLFGVVIVGAASRVVKGPIYRWRPDRNRFAYQRFDSKHPRGTAAD